MPSRCCSPSDNTSPHSLRASQPASRSSKYLGGERRQQAGEAVATGSRLCHFFLSTVHVCTARLHALPLKLEEQKNIIAGNTLCSVEDKSICVLVQSDTYWRRTTPISLVSSASRSSRPVPAL